MNLSQVNRELKIEERILDYLDRSILKVMKIDSTDASKVTPLSENKLTLHSSSEQELLLELTAQRRAEINLLLRLERLKTEISFQK